MRCASDFDRRVVLWAFLFAVLSLPVYANTETKNLDESDDHFERAVQSDGRTKRLLHTKKKKKEDAPALSVTEILSRLKQFYNKNEPPSQEHPTEVKLGIYVNSFYSINEQTMDYSVSMYLRQSWLDHRLSFAHFSSSVDQVRMGDSSWKEIWVPDTFFRNEKSATFHEVTVSNRMLRLTKEGNLWYVTKISATLSCPMDLQKYPLDTQSCPMMFESFGYTMDIVYFTWLDDPVDIEKDLQLPQFTLEEKILHDCSQNYTAGAFPCLEIQFVLRRDVGFFLIQVYVPSILIVILSWVSFWINVDASPARVSIGLLTVLTTTTMSAGARASLPRVSYIKAIDVWMIVCLVFVFASLIEYAVVNVLSRSTQPSSWQSAARLPLPSFNFPTRSPAAAAAAGGPRQNAVNSGKAQIAQTLLNGPGDLGHMTEARVPLAPIDYDGKFQARRIDKLSRKIFPSSFVLFNVIYWTFYAFPTLETNGAKG